MRKVVIVIVFVAILAPCPGLYSQGVPKPQRFQGALAPHPYMRHAIIEHHAGSATVKADFGTPLLQAITAVREEYGWVVDYEDPPYSGKHDVMDVTNPKYRAAHPNAPVVLGPAGGAFQSTYPETPNMWSSHAAEQEVLEKVVSDYNQSGNPGNFTVRELPDGSFDVVGTSIHDNSGGDVPIKPILDTPISIPLVARSYPETLNAILAALPVKAGLGAGPTNLLMGGGLKVGGTDVPARNLVMQVIGTWRAAKWVWSLRYNVNDRLYFLNIEIATRAEFDSVGGRRLIPVSPGQ